MNDELKPCRKCGCEFTRDKFYKRSSSRDGLALYCKSCSGNMGRAWYERNLEHHKNLCSKYYQENRDALLDKMRSDRKENAHIYRAKDKSRRARGTPGGIKKVLLDVEWKLANKDKVRSYRVASEARRRAVSGRVLASEIESIAELQKFKCAICTKCIKNSRHVDHINPLSKGGLNISKNIQILCPTCNVRKSAKDPLEYMRSLGMLL